MNKTISDLTQDDKMQSMIDSKYLIGADFRYDGSERSDELSIMASTFNFPTPGYNRKSKYVASSMLLAGEDLITENVPSEDDNELLSSKAGKYLGR